MRKTPPPSARKEQAERFEKMTELLNELAEDNTAVVGGINRVLETQQGLRADLVREVVLLREELAGGLIYRALKDLCNELIPPLTATEAMLAQADFNNAATIRGHVGSLALTLRNVLHRLGAEKIAITLGEETFNPYLHSCVQVLTPDDSPFPHAAPHTVVRLIEDGYTLGGHILSPAKVEIQAASAKQAADEPV